VFVLGGGVFFRSLCIFVHKTRKGSLKLNDKWKVRNQPCQFLYEAPKTLVKLGLCSVSARSGAAACLNLERRVHDSETMFEAAPPAPAQLLRM
jgi:hypothetical protein